MNKTKYTPRNVLEAIKFRNFDLNSLSKYLLRYSPCFVDLHTFI